MMTTMNYLHLLRHHDVDHFYHYFGNDPETKKKFDQMKHFEEPTCITLFNVGNTISTVTNMNETTALQLSTVVDNGLIEGY